MAGRKIPIEEARQIAIHVMLDAEQARNQPLPSLPCSLPEWVEDFVWKSIIFLDTENGFINPERRDECREKLLKQAKWIAEDYMGAFKEENASGEGPRPHSTEN